MIHFVLHLLVAVLYTRDQQQQAAAADSGAVSLLCSGWRNFLPVRIKDVPYSSYSSWAPQSGKVMGERIESADIDSGYKVWLTHSDH